MWTRQLNIIRKKLWTYKNHTGKIINPQRRLSTNQSLQYDLQMNGVCLDNYISHLEKQFLSNKASNLKPIALIIDRLRAITSQIENLSELLSDKDPRITKLAADEKTSYTNNLNTLKNTLFNAVLDYSWSEDAANISDSTCMTLEVSAGVGGQEAMLFASELFDMYVGFVRYKRWDHYVAEQQQSDLGGIRHGSIVIQDPEAMKYMQHEAGVHRVQRIPATEKSGRIHTSTVSVLAIPQPADIEVVFGAGDLKIETKRATGAGGQHVNTTDSAVRIVHVPSGVAVECQTDRSQIRNKQIALQRLRAKLHDQQVHAQLARTQSLKSTQVESSSRNRKIRTYNYSQDRVTDHRIANANVYNVRMFLLGGQPLQDLIDKVTERVKCGALLKAISEYERKNK